MFVLEEFEFHLGLEFGVFKQRNFVFQKFSGLNSEHWVLDFLDLGQEFLDVGICAFVVSGEVALMEAGWGVGGFVDLGEMAVGGHLCFESGFLLL